MLDAFPASDKSFSRLLGEVPVLPDSTLELLHKLCSCDITDNRGKDTPDIERVTQGLGTVWNLIVKRPYSRQACLDIALKVEIIALFMFSLCVILLNDKRDIVRRKVR